MKIKINAVQSNQDGGWYAEVWDVATGKKVMGTQVFKTKGDAIAVAIVWGVNNKHDFVVLEGESK